MRFASLIVLCVGLCLGVGCTTQPLSTCGSPLDCPRGTCLQSPRSNQFFCAFEWGTCPSGLRWSPEAADDLARRCVGNEEGVDMARPADIEFPPPVDLPLPFFDLPAPIDIGSPTIDFGLPPVDLAQPPFDLPPPPGPDL